MAKQQNTRKTDALIYLDLFFYWPHRR